MSIKKMTIVSFALSTILGLSASAQLLVTEVDPSGTDLADPVAGTPDDVEFIELTNCGPTALDVDGQLWYDDESGDPLDAAGSPILGITSIGPNESVIAVNVGDDFNLATASAAFLAEFPGYTGQIAAYNGSGLSGNPANDDGATIFLQATAPVAGDTPLTELIYPNAPAAGFTFQQSCSGLTEVLAPTPGFAVPEPSTLGLVLVGFLALVGSSRRRR